MKAENPTQLEKGKGSLRLSRVGRGGDWHYYPYGVRASVRDTFTPAYRGSNLGFRLVRNK